MREMPRVVPEYKEEARSRILDSARQVFDEKGYRQATMDDIARKLGVSKGALYLYFASKEELFYSICKTGPVALKEILYSTFGDKTDPSESVVEFFDKMLTQYGSNLGLSFEILSEASRNPPLRRVLKETQDEFTQVLVGFLQEGRNRGLVGDALDLRSLSRALIALWNGLETMIVSGLSVAEAKRAWLEAMKAIFTLFPTEKSPGISPFRQSKPVISSPANSTHNPKGNYKVRKLRDKPIISQSPQNKLEITPQTADPSRKNS